jgi:hypothetical protein
VHRMCRTTGHQWDVFNDFFSRRPSFGYMISLRCMRCGTVRNDVVDAYGFTLGRRYRYPAGYSYDSDVDGELPSRADFKLHLARQHGVDISETDTGT